MEELRRLLQETNEQQAVLALNTRFNFFIVLLLTNDHVKQIGDDCCCCPPVLRTTCGWCSFKSISCVFECVSGRSSYFSCNVASLFWRQDLWGILRNLHPVTKSWKRSQKKHLIIISTLTSGIVVRNAFKTGSRGMRTIHTGKRVWYTTERLY